MIIDTDKLREAIDKVDAAEWALVEKLHPETDTSVANRRAAIAALAALRKRTNRKYDIVDSVEALAKDLGVTFNLTLTYREADHDTHDR